MKLVNILYVAVGFKFAVSLPCENCNQDNSNDTETYGEDYEPHPRYAYNYGVHDPNSGDFKQQSETRDGDVVQGQYSVVEADGSVRFVQYVADNTHGFKAIVTRVSPRDGEPTNRPPTSSGGGRKDQPTLPTLPTRPNKYQFQALGGVSGRNLNLYTLQNLAGNGNGYAIMRVPQPALTSAVILNENFHKKRHQQQYITYNLPPPAHHQPQYISSGNTDSSEQNSNNQHQQQYFTYNLPVHGLYHQPQYISNGNTDSSEQSSNEHISLLPPLYRFIARK